MGKSGIVRWGKKLALFIGLALLVLLVIFSEPELLISYFSEVNLGLFILAFLLSLIGTVLRTERWRVLVGGKEGLPFIRSLYWYFAGFFWGSLSPGRVAELYRVKWLLHRKINFGHATASVLLDRLFDLIAMALAALVSFALLAYLGVDINYAGSAQDIVPDFSPDLSQGLTWGYLVIGIVVILSVLLTIMKSPSGREIFRKVVLKLKEIGQAVIGYSRSTLWLGAGWTVVAMIFFLLERWLLAKAVGIEASVLYIYASIFGAALLSLLPITIQGVGTRDVIFVVLLGMVGVPQEQALVFSSVILVIILLHATLGYVATIIVRDDTNAINGVE